MLGIAVVDISLVVDSSLVLGLGCRVGGLLLCGPRLPPLRPCRWAAVQPMGGGGAADGRQCSYALT